DYNAVQVVVLHKEVGMGLGFSVAGGVDQNKPVTVHRVFPSGIAAQEGSIQEGDTVLSINGTSLCGCAHWEALRVLRRARIRNLGVVVLRRGEVSNVSKIRTETSSSGPTQARVTEKDAAFAGQRVCVRLEKKGRDLGFSLEGGVGSSLENRPITVQRIFQSGPAGQVFPGDEILEINGVSTAGMRRIEAWNLIRKLPAGPADLFLRRLHQETCRGAT
uniref:Si:dkey-92i15.4 n=2 Tax=Tetraodon nigroviridis TaxID=99883 RepID=H3DLV8_TETNG